MKTIAFDIGHPAHIHYFRNIINFLLKNNINVLISARDKEITLELLNEYKYKYFNRGKGGKGVLGKILYIFKADYILYNYYKRYKPDLFISFGSVYLSHVSKLLNKKHIVLDDTEHATFSQLLYKYFSDIIITPSFFKKNISSSKQIRFNGFFEQAYLRDIFFNNIQKDILINKYINNNSKKNILLRFVSWNAVHDTNQDRLTMKDKIELVNYLSEYGNIFISSEHQLPKELQKYELTIPKSLIHEFLTRMDLLVSESGTMSTEGALLGVPTILTINPKLANQFGNFIKLQSENILKVEFSLDKIKDNTDRMLNDNYKVKIKEQVNELWKNSDNINIYLLEIIKKELNIDFTNSYTS